MSKLLRLSQSSDIMDVSIKYGKEKFSFNLYKELVIDENLINKELKEQAPSYAFLSMLHKKLIRYCKDLELENHKIMAEEMDKLRSDKDPSTGRPPSKEVCEIKIKGGKRWQEKQKEINQAKHNAEVIESCIISFEQRKDLIQTLSANIRKEQ